MKLYRMIILTALLALLIAACSPAPAGQTGVTPQAPVDSAPAATIANTLAVPEAGTGVELPCVGVDTNQLVAAGQELYQTRCASCHGPEGEGVGNFPAITGNINVTGENVVQLVQDYFAVGAHPKELSADELASMFSYMRGAFGNTATVICPADITIPALQ